MLEKSRHYQQVKQALEIILAQSPNTLTLGELANKIAMSEHHFQRVFSEWVGVSPQKFQQYLIKNKAKPLLQTMPVHETSLALGLSSASRLYDLMVHHEGMTPGEYKQQGADLTIEYGWFPSPFGLCFIALTERGICKLAFFDSEKQRQYLLDELMQQWSLATIIPNQEKALSTLSRIFQNTETPAKPLHVLLKGTAFQIQVWEALLKVPEGQLCSYSDLAMQIDKPKAVRAASSAVANNPIAYLIPCHRVIRKSGAINQYRWGAERKQAMLIKECLLKD